VDNDFEGDAHDNDARQHSQKLRQIVRLLPALDARRKRIESSHGTSDVERDVEEVCKQGNKVVFVLGAVHVSPKLLCALEFIPDAAAAGVVFALAAALNV
jgi:hypothetical protein